MHHSSVATSSQQAVVRWQLQQAGLLKEPLPPLVWREWRHNALWPEVKQTGLLQPAPHGAAAARDVYCCPHTPAAMAVHQELRLMLRQAAAPLLVAHVERRMVAQLNTLTSFVQSCCRG